jgi:hypothetical protein
MDGWVIGFKRPCPSTWPGAAIATGAHWPGAVSSLNFWFSSWLSKERGHYRMPIMHFGGLGGDGSLLVPRFNSKRSASIHVRRYASPVLKALAADQARPAPWG